jgi:hypothetical protein
MQDPAPGLPIRPAGAALFLAALVALALNPGTPLAWAYDAPLPEALTLAAIRAGEAIGAAGLSLGLDAPGEWLRGIMARLTGA